MKGVEVRSRPREPGTVVEPSYDETVTLTPIDAEPREADLEPLDLEAVTEIFPEVEPQVTFDGTTPPAERERRREIVGPIIGIICLAIAAYLIGGDLLSRAQSFF